MKGWRNRGEFKARVREWTAKLDAEETASLAEAKWLAREHRYKYSNTRPHSGLGYTTRPSLPPPVWLRSGTPNRATTPNNQPNLP